MQCFIIPVHNKKNLMPSQSSKSGLQSCICDSLENITTIDLESINPTEKCIANLPQYTIDFGQVYFGSKIKQVVRLQNLLTDDPSSYTLIKDPNSNPIYQAFDFDNMDKPILKSNILEKMVTFHPKIPNEKYVDHFYLTQDNVYIITILLKGECIGPEVQLSIKSLFFKQRKAHESVEIVNNSEMRICYQFDVNGTDYDIFQVDHPFGNLESKQHKIINISFCPKKPGIYTKYLSCLILYQEPKIIKLTGIYLSDTTNLKKLKHYPKAISEASGFIGFMTDSLTLLNNVPPFSLSQNFLDFGMVEMGPNKPNHKTLVTSLTNHMKSPIKVVWINHDVFKISPKKIQIPMEESILYEVTFKPDGSESIFNVDLIGTVLWSDENAEKTFTLVPQNISLRLLGNSFYDNTSWVPQLEMMSGPVIFPCCVPAFPSFASFILKATGCLPVSFKFIPPNRSNFIIKPMVGLVSCYQIIYAQFHPLNTQSKGYVERWEIQLNGRTGGHGIPFFLKGYCEYPAILVGKDNTIRFSTMLPGAREKESVSLKNLSAHFLQYQFMLSSDEPRYAHLDIKYAKGDLAANESVVLDWFCTGNEKMPRETKVPYTLRYLQSSSKVVGTEFVGEVTIYATCAEAKLCSIPNNLLFHNIQFGCKETTTFKLFNFGESTLHFFLWNNDEHNVIDISPIQGTVKCNDYMTINIVLNPLRLGRNNIDIYYYLRVFKDSAELLSTVKHKIFEITYTCKLSCIQIADIEYHDYGQLFNRLYLWKIMNIENLNTILRTISPNETKDIDMFLPEYREKKQVFTTYLTLKNVSQFDTNVSLVRKQMCDCKTVQKTVGLSFRKLEYDCIHREMVQIEMDNNYLNTNCCTTITIKCKYSMSGKSILCYIMKLSNNREIILKIHIRTLGSSESVISIFGRGSEFRLNDTYIGELEPFLQTYWVYNNTGKVIQYFLDLSEINDLQFKNKFPIIECGNPMGYISPCKPYPLVFKFSPLEAITYLVLIPIIVDEDIVLVLKVVGNGLMHPKKIEFTMRHPFRASIVYNSVVASVEHLSLPPIGLWSEVHRVIFIKNYSNDVTYYYSWQDCSIVGLVEIEFDKPKGVISPKETHFIRIIVHSLHHACLTTIHMYCKLLSQDAYFEHKRTSTEYLLMQKKIEGEFTMTELGMSRPENTVIITPMPAADFLSMSLDVCIVSTTDRDLHMTGKYQMESFPESTTKLKAVRTVEMVGVREDEDRKVVFNTHENQFPKLNCATDVIQMVLQMIVGDVVYCKLFDYIMDELKTSLPPYHYQMKITNNEEKQHENKQHFKKRRRKSDHLVVQAMREPQRTLLRDVLGDLIQNSLHDVFKIGTEASHTTVSNIVLNVTHVCVCSKPLEKGEEE